MTALVVGISHRSAPVSVLDRGALTAAAASELSHAVLASPYVAESVVVATCNRIEVYADVTKFHGGVLDVTDALAKATGLPREELTPYLYVSYDDRAVQHLFEVASGLDSMVVGEQQILGQVRGALRTAQEQGTAGRSLNDLVQSALRVGKQVHSSTGIDRAIASIVSVALDESARVLGALAGKRALVIGAGAMSGLAVALLSRAGVTDLIIANRTPERARSVAAQVNARAISLADMPLVLGEVDLIVSCTGARGLVLELAVVSGARATGTDPLVVVDLALPHDTAPELSSLAGVTRIDLARLTELPGATASVAEVAAARDLVAAELAAYVASQAAQRVEPIVASLRARADDVVNTEVQRLRLRLPTLDDRSIAEVSKSLRRAVGALLHTPTVRMKQFAADPDGDRYAATLHRLFDLDPESIAALSLAELSATDERTATNGSSVFDLTVPGPETS